MNKNVKKILVLLLSRFPLLVLFICLFIYMYMLL